MLLFVLVIGTLQAQNLQLHYDLERGYATSTFEMFKPDKWGNTFMFVDFDFNGGNMNQVYGEIARVLKTEKMPVGLHLEYNGGTSNQFSFANAFIFGVNYAKGNADRGFSTYLGYKTFKGTGKANMQLTATWYLHLFNKKVSCLGFVDLWTEEGLTDNTVFLTEPQLWYNINKNLSLGGEVEISNNFAFSTEFKVRPTVAVKWNF